MSSPGPHPDEVFNQTFEHHFPPTLEAIASLDQYPTGNVDPVQLAASRAAASLAAQKGLISAETWERHHTPDGKAFFYHRHTKRRQWSLPDGAQMVEPKKKKRKLTSTAMASPMFDEKTGHAIQSGVGEHVMFAGAGEVRLEDSFVYGGSLKMDAPGRAEPESVTLEELRSQLAAGLLDDDDDDDEAAVEEDVVKFNPWGATSDFDVDALLDEVDDLEDSGKINKVHPVEDEAGESHVINETEEKSEPFEEELLKLLIKLKVTSPLSVLRPRLLYEKAFRNIPKDRQAILYDKCLAKMQSRKLAQENLEKKEANDRIEALLTALKERRRWLLTGPSFEDVKDKFPEHFPGDSHFEIEARCRVVLFLSPFVQFKQSFDELRVNQWTSLVYAMLAGYIHSDQGDRFLQTYTVDKLEDEANYPMNLYQEDLTTDSVPVLKALSPKPVDVVTSNERLRPPSWSEVLRLFRGDVRFLHLPKAVEPVKIYNSIISQVFSGANEANTGPPSVTNKDRDTFFSVLEQCLPSNPFSIRPDELESTLLQHRVYSHNAAIKHLDEKAKRYLFFNYLQSVSDRIIEECELLMKKHQDHLSQLLIKNEGHMFVSDIIDCLKNVRVSGSDKISSGVGNIDLIREVVGYEQKVMKKFSQWRKRLMGEWEKSCIEYLQSTSRLKTEVPTSELLDELSKDLRLKRIMAVDRKLSNELINKVKGEMMKMKSAAKTNRIDEEDAQQNHREDRLSDFNKVKDLGFDEALNEDD
eukprot:GHVH01000002.1.p1 GENE.GHVH01000002.1~~GHVH01000002.1.p1  ORF type:complete len:753 (+),score=146.24 GHVH01000002.1:52-2310(+)